MLCHRQFVAIAAFMAALALLPPAIHVFLQRRPAARTVDLNFWLVRPWSRDGRQLRSLSLSYLGDCLPEDDFKRLLERNIGISPPYEIASVDMLTCHEGNEVNGDARALAAATAHTKSGKFSCNPMPREQWTTHKGRSSELCVLLKDYDVNLFNARVQMTVWEDFENATDPYRWAPVTLDAYRHMMDMVGDTPLPPLAITNCDERLSSLRRNKCLKGNRASFVGIQHTFPELWYPKEIVVQVQIRMLHSFKAGKEGGPGTVRLFQQLPEGNTTLPGVIEVSVDWNRMGKSNEVPTGACVWVWVGTSSGRSFVCARVCGAVWVNFRTQNTTAPVASYTFHSRILEDCRSHVITVHLRASGLGSLYIDGFERARYADCAQLLRLHFSFACYASLSPCLTMAFLVLSFVMVPCLYVGVVRFAMAGTPPSRAQAMITSSRWAGVAWFNATTGTVVADLNEEDVTERVPTRSGLLYGETEKDRSFLKPFFLVPYASIVVSGWGVTQVLVCVCVGLVSKRCLFACFTSM
jgi:hypothetical protein